MAYDTIAAAIAAARSAPEAEWAGVCIAEALDGAGFGLSFDLFNVGCEIGADEMVFANGWHHPGRIVRYLAPRSMLQQG